MGINETKDKVKGIRVNVEDEQFFLYKKYFVHTSHYKPDSMHNSKESLFKRIEELLFNEK